MGLAGTTPEGMAGFGYSHVAEPAWDRGCSGTSPPWEKLVGGWQFTLVHVMQTQHTKTQQTTFHKCCHPQNSSFSSLHFTSQDNVFDNEVLSTLLPWAQCHPELIPVHCKATQTALWEKLHS